MKKFILICLLTLSFNVKSQTINSVLDKGLWYKFAVSKTGVFKIDKTFLQNLGVDVGKINPKQLKIYGNGGGMLSEKVSDFRNLDLQENAIFVSGESDGVFNDDDYILFYGVGAHQWEVNRGIPKHIQNIYSDKAYYFLNINDSNGKRIPKSPVVNEAVNTTFTNYDDYVFYEKELINLIGLGQKWFGEDFSVENVKNFSLPFKNVDPTSDVTIVVEAMAQSSRKSDMRVSVNDNFVGMIEINPKSSSTDSGLAREGTLQSSITPANLYDISITYNNRGIPSAKGFLNYIEIYGKKLLIADDNQFLFRNFEAEEIDGVIAYQIKNADKINQVWNVTNPLSPELVSSETKNNDLIFKSNSYNKIQEFVVLTSQFFQPEIIGNQPIENQNLHGIKDVEYLVITNNTLKPEAQRLATYHQNNSNLATKVVEVSKIYNEFSSGAPDITAIRDFIKYLHDNSKTKKLKYVCFFGDSSYDFKNRISNNNNIVPTYHNDVSFSLVSSIVTDDYFVMISNEDGGLNSYEEIDIASGRIPVTTQLEAKRAVDKILSYYDTKSFGDWRNTITLIADDVDASSDTSLQRGIEEVADGIKKNKPELNVAKIYADAYKQETSSGGERYPQVKEAITNAVEKGSLIVDYFGHGGEDGWAKERFLEIPQIQSFKNAEKLPLFITVTCEFSRFDNPLRDTAGEKLFRNPKGGSVSMITTTRAVKISVGEIFNETLTEYILGYNGEDNSIAYNLMQAKNDSRSRDSQKYFIFYFGDPAMKLATPKPNIVLTKINGKDISKAADSLKALSKVRFEGIVIDKSNKIIPSFNGVISTTIFDKPIDKETLGNHGSGEKMIFDSQESKIYRGKSSVKNGKFSFEFVVPKDIKIAYGKGKVSMYANNNKVDKAGANFDITVGGVNENAVADVTGPEISAFMEDENFIDGGNTTNSPELIINLEDQNGINTSITAVDHDIVAILDGNESEPIILNDFYETELDDFTKGKVVYKLQDLTEGNHTLKIKAWDTYNNSSETTITFNVVIDRELRVTNVLNYPNPFVSYTEFWFTHNKPNQLLDVEVQVFTVSGKLVKTIHEQVTTTTNLCRSISWNGLDDFGNKLAKGVYVYRLKVNSNNNLTSEKYEKLVIL